jgi:hypothetical protein
MVVPRLPARRAPGVSGIEVCDLSGASAAGYEAFLQTRPEATLYHSARYCLFLRDLLGCRIEHLVVLRDGAMTGALPLMSRDGPLGTVLNSLPFFGSYGGVLADDDATAQALWKAYGGRIAERSVGAATVIANPFAKAAGDPVVPLTHRDERIAQFSSLTSAADFPGRLRQEIDGSARRNIQKAENAGIAITVENEALDFLREGHGANMAEIGGTTKPVAFFSLLPQHFRPDVDYRLYLARREGEPIAALLVLYYKQFAEYFIPVTVAEHREQQPMALILFRAMCDAAAAGMRIWNWGGTWLAQTGVYRFKRKWGAVEAKYGYSISVRNPALLAQTAAALTAAYPFFYVAPFGALPQ